MPPNVVQYLLLENLIFLGVSTGFLVAAGYAWRDLKPFTLPEPLPNWFSLWFGGVQVLGGLVPILVLIWGLWRQNFTVLFLFTPYFLLLGLQILVEIVALRQARSVIWVMVPYLYVPYRLWQLWEGWLWLDKTTSSWLGWLLVAELAVWVTSYLLALSQLPRLLRWSIFSEP
ncbi:MAG: hypothetical protein ACFB5Z_08920 [Elainellaceae cyanobacterium]